MKCDRLHHWLVATAFLGSSLPTTTAASTAASTAAHTSFGRGLRGGTTYTPHTPRDLQRNPPSESVTCAAGLVDVQYEHDTDSIGDDKNTLDHHYVSCETPSGKSYKLNGASDSVEAKIMRA